MEFGAGFWHSFELTGQGKKSLVFEITVQERTVYIRSGVAGCSNKAKRQVFASNAEAERAVRQLIQEKLESGYSHVESKF